MRRSPLDTTYLTFIFAVWPMTTLAGGVTLGLTLAGIGPWDWAVVLVLSGVAGGVALLQRMRNEASAYVAMVRSLDYGQDVPPQPNWYSITLFHMGAAFLAGGLTFLGCEAVDMEDFREALAIGVAAWTGAKLLDIASDSIIGTVKGLIAGPANRT